MNAKDSYTEQAQNLPFAEKLQWILALLEQDEIDEAKAYQILLAGGEPKPSEPAEPQIGSITFF